MISGQCACGAVKFQVDGDMFDFSHCHCSICRKLHGGVYATFAGVERDRFRYTEGEESLSFYLSSERNVRVFCRNCGSTMLCDPQDEPDALYLSMSAIDGNPPRPAAYHAYVGSKAVWHEITDSDPQYDRLKPGDVTEP